jgi:hypothetical protein
MDQEQWSAVDRYITDLLVPSDPVLDATVEANAELGLPPHLILIDADKQSNPEYFIWALKLTRRGSLIIADNVVRGGAVIDAASEDGRVQGIRRFYELVAAEPGVQLTGFAR